MSGSLPNTGAGSLTLSSGLANILPVGFGYYPPEGARVVATQYSWAAQSSFAEDLSQIVARGVETAIQGVWIDNSACNMPVSLFIGQHQTINIGPGQSGVYPVFFSGTPQFIVSVPAPIVGITKLAFLNTPVGCESWPVGFPIDGGQKTILNQSTGTSVLLKTGPGRVGTVSVVASNGTAGMFIQDTTTLTPSAATALFYIAATVTAGTIYTLNMPFFTGLALVANGAGTGNISVSYT